MKVSCETGANKITFHIEPGDSENGPETKYSGKTTFYYSTDEEIFNPHPDKLALVAILNLLPFAREELEIQWGISKRMQDACEKITRVKVHSKYEHVEESSPGLLGPALSFSGGADSTAALAVMPSNTECVFLLRTKNLGRTLYNSDAAEHSCRKLRTLGYKVHIVESDFEYLRNPIGFPTDLSVGTPSILLSDARDFDSISFGTILESAFGIAGSSFREYCDSGHYRLWNELFASAGINYSIPIAGVSEVGSTLICERHPLGKVHQSCIRGKWGKPCESCWKCFRKNSLLLAIKKTDQNIDFIKKISNSKEVTRKVTQERPIKHEGVLTYSFERIKSLESDSMGKLRRLVRVGEIRTDWMERWYSGSSGLIYKGHREEVCENLERILGKMNDEDIEELREWTNLHDDIREMRLIDFCMSANISQ